MLYEFVRTYRDQIIAKTRAKVITRAWPPPSTIELENGVPIFLTQLAETLRQHSSVAPFSTAAIGSSATRHGRDLLGLGFTVSQVVHDYGDICQAVTELAVEQGAPLTTEESHILNRCLDVAIADAVAFGDRRGRDRTGLGLGLSIARKAVRSQGGDIYIRNMPGEGCTFVVEIPQAVDEIVPLPPGALPS